jgi:DNA invertase Pin-like site-specific DNA recombinase
MDAQKDIVERYFEFLKAEHPELRWGDWIEDPAVSAYAGSRHRFFQRPDGQRLLDLAQPGDHVIVAKLDRAFRDVRDCLASMDLFKERGIVFHACDFRIDTDTANGELMLTFMAAIARWQSRYISERTKAGLNARMKKGLPLGPVPAGSKAVGTMSEKERKRRRGKGSPRHFVPDEKARSIMAEIVLVRQAGLSWRQISDHVESQLARGENRPPEERYWRRQWSPRYCRRAYFAELALRAQAAVARKVSPSPAPVSPTPEVAGQPTA